MAIIGSALRLVLFLTFLTPHAELPLGLSWDSPDTAFFEASEQWAEDVGVFLAKGILESEVDPRFYVFVGQYGSENANDNDLNTAAYYGPDGSLIGLSVRAAVYDGNPFYVVSELEKQYPDADVTYSSRPDRDEYRFQFPLEAHSMVVTLRAADRGPEGEWQVWAVLSAPDSERSVSELFPYVPE